MNYANMIEEKKLKKGFIIATLVSTVIGTFTASMNLHEKMKEKKAANKQRGVDDGQNVQIQQLRAEVDKLQLKRSRDRSRSSSSSRSSSRRRRRRRGRSASYDDDEDFRRSAGRSRAMIEREYDENFSRLGQRYAQGDVLTENRLQAQIITLQQAVINVLHEALMNGRTLSRADTRRLIAAQDLARQGSLEALRGQYERLLPETNPPSRWRIEAPPGSGPLQRQLTLPAPEHKTFAPPKRVQSMPIPPKSAQLYCRYSVDLQASRAPLAPVFAANGPCRCPGCDIRLNVSRQDFWTFEVCMPVGKDRLERRIYEMDARMVVKSHTPHGDYACVLCTNERDLDCICKSVEVLVEHMGRTHTAAEFERERDMHRI